MPGLYAISDRFLNVSGEPRRCGRRLRVRRVLRRHPQDGVRVFRLAALRHSLEDGGDAAARGRPMNSRIGERAVRPAVRARIRYAACAALCAFFVSSSASVPDRADSSTSAWEIISRRQRGADPACLLGDIQPRPPPSRDEERLVARCCPRRGSSKHRPWVCFSGQRMLSAVGA